MSVDLDPVRTAQLADALRAARRPAPDPLGGWCPDRPGPERLARLVLHRRWPGDRYDLVSDRQVRSALAETTAGYQLQDRIDRRAAVLAEWTEVVADLLGVVGEGVGRIQAVGAGRPELAVS